MLKSAASSLVLTTPPPLTEHPAAVYLASLSPGSRPTMRQALDTIARLLTDGRADYLTLNWAEFIARCQEKGTTATSVLTEFIKLYLDDSLDDLDVNTLDKRFDERVRARVDEYLANHPLQNQVTALSEKIAYLEGRLSSYLERTNTKPTAFKKEREFWFVQDRAKYLGYTINAEQRLKIDMFAADVYKERHGRPPSKKMYRGIPTSVYPAADVDILDSFIKGVVKRG